MTSQLAFQFILFFLFEGNSYDSPPSLFGERLLLIQVQHKTMVGDMRDCGKTNFCTALFQMCNSQVFCFCVMAKLRHFCNVSTRNMLKNYIANKIKWDHSSIFGWKYPWVVLLRTTSRNEKGTKNIQIIFLGPLL
jgi:hypothetical protein